MNDKASAATGKIEFTTTTAGTPSDAGTSHPVSLLITYVSPAGNANHKVEGHLEAGVTWKHEFDTSASVGTVRSVSLMLNGLAPSAPDNWRPTHFKLDIIRNGARESVFDIPWNTWFDSDHRSQTIYQHVDAGMQAVGVNRREIDAAAAVAAAAGRDSAFTWHYGSVTGLGFFVSASGREVVILWDEGGASRAQGLATESQWEIFKLAYENGGRIAVLSDKLGQDWKFDYRFLEAQR